MMYCIDLDARRPEVLFYKDEDFKGDLKHFGCKNLEQLNGITIDRQAFTTESEADAFLKLFNATLNSLKDFATSYQRGLPQLALPRRHLALVIMGIKTATVRTFLLKTNGLGVVKGDLFNFSDRTFGVTCKIKHVECVENNYIYNFERY